MKIRDLMLLSLAVLSLLAGCTSFYGVKPISPSVGNPNYPRMAENLQPTFRWEPSQEPGASYDFILYQGIKIESFWEGIKRSVGREVYYRQGLAAPEHRVEEPLQPNMEYYWTVRTRMGERVSDWARYDYTLFLGTAYMQAGNRLFIFKTPPN